MNPTNTYTNLLIFSAIIGGLGIILFLLANVIMKATGDDINRRLDRKEARRYRNMGYLEQMREFYSNPRNIPIALGMIGIAMFFVAICMIIVALTRYQP